MLGLLKRLLIGGPNPYWIVYDIVGARYSLIQSFWRPRKLYYEQRTGPHKTLDEAKDFLEYYRSTKA